jgi:PAS domain S-box-containing protein
MKFLFKRPAVGSEPEPAPRAATPAPVASPAAPTPPSNANAPATSSGPVYRQDHKSLYKQLLRGLYDAVLVTDPKGHVIDSNGRVQDSFQLDRNEVWDMEIAKLVPGITPQLLERVKQGLSENRHVLIDARCVRKDGSVFPAEVAISSIDLINEGDMVFSIRNVERRKRQSQLLRSLQNALVNDLSAVAVCDREGRITYVNQAVRAMWACEDDDQIHGQPVTALWSCDPQADAPIRQALGGARWLGMLECIAQDGRKFRVGAAIDVDRALESQEVVGLVCSFIEIQEG